MKQLQFLHQDVNENGMLMRYYNAIFEDDSVVTLLFYLSEDEESYSFNGASMFIDNVDGMAHFLPMFYNEAFSITEKFDLFV